MNTAPPSPLVEEEQWELAGLLKLARLATNCVAPWTAEACPTRDELCRSLDYGSLPSTREQYRKIQDPESSSGGQKPHHPLTSFFVIPSGGGDLVNGW